jgi:hypothetical protein
LDENEVFMVARKGNLSTGHTHNNEEIFATKLHPFAWHRCNSEK